MSLHVYIATEKFRDDPIPLATWLAAARQHHGLRVDEHVRRNGEPSYRIYLKDNRLARLELDRYGLVQAQAPTRDLIVVMFDLAAAMGLRVYSERLRPYRSPDDWERRTRQFRRDYESNRARHRLKRRLWMGFVSVAGAACVVGVLAWLLQGG